MINHYSTNDGAAERRAPELAMVDIKWGDRVTVDPGTPVWKHRRFPISLACLLATSDFHDVKHEFSHDTVRITILFHAAPPKYQPHHAPASSAINTPLLHNSPPTFSFALSHIYLISSCSADHDR